MTHHMHSTISDFDIFVDITVHMIYFVSCAYLY